MLGRLLLRTLPEEYTSDSSYTWFPLMTPPAMNQILQDLGWSELYEMKRPATTPEVPVLASYDDVKAALKDGASFGTGFSNRVKTIVSGPGSVSLPSKTPVHYACSCFAP